MFIDIPVDFQLLTSIFIPFWSENILYIGKFHLLSLRMKKMHLMNLQLQKKKKTGKQNNSRMCWLILAAFDKDI